MLAVLLSACGGGGVGGASSRAAGSAGNFKALSTNVQPGMRWELNRVIEIEFNHPVDASSISFGSILIRPTSPEIQGHPVTGSFALKPGSGDRVVLFRPDCPTTEEFDDGGFLPGGFTYQLTLPTSRGFGQTVLRDKGGHRLSSGMTVDFRTPAPPTEPLFLDTVEGPPVILSVQWPAGLNFFSNPDPTIEILFNQPIDGRPSNLNLNSLFVLFSDDVVGQPGGSVFSPQNRLPGFLVLAENCGTGGARVFFEVTGLLPPGRKLRLVMKSTFADLVGQRNTNDQVWPLDHENPSLAAVYQQDPSWNEADETVDEFRETFTTTDKIDLAAGIPLPMAKLGDGKVQASFDFPGTFVSDEANFLVKTPAFLEVNTTGTTIVSDSNNRTFQVVEGVLQVHNLTIQGGASLRGRGLNPLVIYATGKVVINGKLDVSGVNSHQPTGLNSPQFPEGGSLGECGGGNGGTASIITNAETPRGENGDGPFGFRSVGGEGGEGGFQQTDGLNGVSTLTAGGGGGGSFARTKNDAVRWNQWSGEERPTFDDRGPDHDASRHPMYTMDSPFWPVGGEAGLRGSTWGARNWPTDPNKLHGMHGMEDRTHDFDEATGFPDEEVTGFDPPWTTGSVPPFVFGDPTKGPDPGRGGPSVFSDDGNTGNDFWGRRLNVDGTVTVGELLTPWAGSGGGASGDSQTIKRQDIDGDGTKDPVEFSWPDPNFPRSYTAKYRKGAPGGGGGGQLIVMAIGPIVIGRNGGVFANGGIGHGGESVIFTNNQVSGSGGGSGGHLILQSATALDLSAIVLQDGTGPGSNPIIFADVSELVDYADNRFADQPQPIQARGGRRGWAADAVKDGNSDFMTGRGGAGGNGVIQVHVPDPGRDILWPVDNAAVIQDYLFDGDPVNNPSNIDRVEQILDIFSIPRAFVLIPFFSAGSQVQGKWIDTGLAGLRNPANGDGPFPDYADPALRFLGIDPADGKVRTTNEQVDRLPAVATGSTATASIEGFQMTVPGASTAFAAQFLRNPNLLVGYDILPSSTGPRSYEIVTVTYDRGADTMSFLTLIDDGPMDFGLDSSNPVWAVIPKFFRAETVSAKDRLPASAFVKFEFQGTEETAPGSNVPDPAQIIPGPTTWTSDLSLLKGKRFLRYRITFNIDAQGSGVSLSSERPAVSYLKIPFAW